MEIWRKTKLMKSCSLRWMLFVGIMTFSLNPVQGENWPIFRGPRGDGTCLEKNVPMEWKVATGCLWKTAVPGIGHSSPVVWGDYLFTATALPGNQERVLLCFDRRTGKIVWQQPVLSAPLEQKHEENSFASGTPSTDGESVYVAFLDQKEIAVAAYGFSGKQRWLVRPGSYASPHGFSCSPVLFKDKVIIVGDNRGESYVVALSKADGKTVWRTLRETSDISYGTPLVREIAGRTQMIVAGNKSVTAFDPNDGSRIWFVKGPSDECVASTFYSERLGLVFAGSSYPQRNMLAIKPDGTGDVTKTHVVWKNMKNGSYVCSPIIEGEYLLTVNGEGLMSCLDPATGKPFWEEKMEKHHASPVSINGLVYFTDDNGLITVIKPGPRFDRVAAYELGEKTYCSPAISDGQVFLRGEKTLFCLGQRVKE